MVSEISPQIIQIFDIGTKLMIDSGAVVPLGDFTAKDPSFPTGEILPEIRRYYEVAGKLYSLPFATSNPIVYYNVDALKKAAAAGFPCYTLFDKDPNLNSLRDNAEFREFLKEQEKEWNRRKETWLKASDLVKPSAARQL